MVKNIATGMESVAVSTGTPTVAPGTSGQGTQVGGEAATVSAAAAASGGMSDANLIGTAVDEELFRFNSEDTPLMNLMLRAKRVNVNSPEVDHYMIDEARSSVVTVDDCGGMSRGYVVLPVSETDGSLLRPYTTLLVKGVSGYDAEGKNPTPGKDLMLFVTG